LHAAARRRSSTSTLHTRSGFGWLIGGRDRARDQRRRVTIYNAGRRCTPISHVRRVRRRGRADLVFALPGHELVLDKAARRMIRTAARRTNSRIGKQLLELWSDRA
jgi:hypothetical protein